MSATTANTARNPLRPADVEQLKRALADHKATRTTCKASQKCDMARRLEKALSR